MAPVYTPSLALQAATDRIKNPPHVFNKKNELVYQKYEHHVSTWACTKLHEVFPQSGDWAITPEQKDRYSRKKPDFIVEKAGIDESDGSATLTTYLCMELKKQGGDRFEEALNQLGSSILETIDGQQTFEVYAVVQVGLKIGFFEFHSDQDNLDEEGIPHFLGFVSLTQHYWIGNEEQIIMEDPPDGVQNLYFNYENLILDTEIRRKAKEYPIPCVFDIESHKDHVHELFCHMVNNLPRSSM
jgi:hypothetical protein